MQIDKITNTNFNGGFRFINMPLEAKKQLPELIGKKQIFYNFEKEGDVFLVTRDLSNFKVGQFIKRNKFDFEFYPSINTKCGFDDEMPEVLSAFLDKLKENPITTRSQLRKYFSKEKFTNIVLSQSPKYVNNILKALCIDNKYKTKIVKGISIIEDTEFQRKILISPPSKFNIHYVKIEPKGYDKKVERYAIDSNGNILTTFNTPEAMKIFNNRFNDLIIK